MTELTRSRVLSERIECIQGDLTVQEVDAVVNAANGRLAGGGGVDGALHRAAGPGLLAECRERHPEGCPTGQVRVTSGHLLPARAVLHAVGPVWEGGVAGEPELLASCYRTATRIAQEEGFVRIAFPAISCGVYGYPHQEAAEVAIEALADALLLCPGVELARVVLFSEDLYRIFEDERRRQAEAP